MHSSPAIPGTISGNYVDIAFSFEFLQVIKIALVQGDFWFWEFIKITQ
jgi:hypothetical protein